MGTPLGVAPGPDRILELGLAFQGAKALLSAVELGLFSELARGPLDAEALREWLRFYGGDFFSDPLPEADVLVMGHILHDWDLDQKLALIRKAHPALPPGGALIVYDYLIDDERRASAPGLLMSLNMLINTAGGFDYTAAECATWMREAGFRESPREHLSGPHSMVVGIK